MMRPLNPRLGVAHIETATALAYSRGEDAVTSRWQGHIDACPSCRSLITLMNNPPVPRRAAGHASSDAVHHWVRISAENIGSPSIGRLVNDVNQLLERSWVNGDLDTLDLGQRIERDDIVLVALGQDSDRRPPPLGVVFGRLSSATDPKLDDLGWDGQDRVRSLNLYAHLLNVEGSTAEVERRLLREASRTFCMLAPQLQLRTISPLAGFRSFVGRVLRRVDPAPRIEQLLADPRLTHVDLESGLGVTAHRWLDRAWTSPALVLEQWRAANRAARHAMETLLRVFAEHHVDTHALLGRVGHLTLSQGAHFCGAQAFSCLSAPRSLFMTTAFEYRMQA